MARKRRPEGDGPRRRRARPTAPENFPDLPDRRTLERALRQLVGRADPGTPQGQAEELVAQAFEEGDPQKQVDLARRALELWPDGADAYVLLAENAGSRKDALRLYQQGVEAGERALGPEVFARDAGHFWGLLETRPYLRARLGLAHALWTAGRRPEAVEHLRDLLRLNPNDNQGVRYTLAGYLLFLDRDDDLARLLRHYPEEGTAAWAYTQALLAFRQGGDSPAARQLLQQAIKTNRHVPDYLLGRKFPPPERPASYRPGDDSEALQYLGGFLAGWKSTPGAIAWLRAHDPKTQQRKALRPHPRGPLPMVKGWLKRKLSQEPDVWQADARPMANVIQIAGERVRPWVVLVISPSNDLVLAHALLEEEPGAASLWDTLVQAMQNPAAGEPHRPTALQVQADERWESLRPHVEEVGIELVTGETLDHFSRVFADLSEHVAGKPPPGLLDVPGVRPEQVARFYRAAADFFRQAPWRAVGYEAAIRVKCSKYQSGPWYAILMGQSGLTTGLALYEDLENLRAARERPADYRENARQSVATTVLFGEEVDLPLADVEAARRYGWEVARPDAWPLVLHKERGLAHRPPLAWEVELLEGCLRAIPEFVRRRPQDDPSEEELTVPAAAGELKISLAWVPEAGA
jgi:tetratricopeptide (TPR) repeat protein